jgi:hypothetical protein
MWSSTASVRNELMTSTNTLDVSRDQVLAYRARVHGLGDVAEARRDHVLGTGLQDNPPGRTALVALALRGRHSPRGTSLVHSMRAAMHLHRSADLGRYAAALRHQDGSELSDQSFGPFGGDLAASGLGFGEALDGVAAAMSDVMADGVARTKGELSGAVTPLVDRRVAPWCDGCGVHHVYDALFRYGTLQAGLEIEVESPTLFRFVRSNKITARADPDRSRAEIVRRFLRMAGPVRPVHLALWLGLTPAGAKRWWTLAEDQLTAVSVDGRKAWMHAEDVPELTDPPEPPVLRLLPPYDPVTELGDRELLVPDPAQRRKVWRAVSNPGVLLVRGDLGGVWRQRTSGGRLTITLDPFAAFTGDQHRAAAVDAQTLARHSGARDVEVRIAEPAVLDP